MTKFQVNNSYIKNIINVSDKEITNCLCTIHINNERDIKIPLLVALSTFENISLTLNSDITSNEFNLDIDFTTDTTNTSNSAEIQNNNNDATIRNTFYDKFTEILYGREVTLTTEEINILAKIGRIANNDSFIIPYNDKLKKLEETLSLSNVFDIVSMKLEYCDKFNAEEYRNEIALISSNFETQKDKIIDISRDKRYKSFIHSIVQDSHLQLEDEDSLLEFILQLCSISYEYETLFDSVFLEYCSIEYRISS